MHSQFHRNRRLLFVPLLLIALVGALVTTTAARASTWHPRTWHLTVGIESPNNAIQGMAFLPREVWIDQGDTIVWTVRSGEIHTVTFMPPGQTPPPFTGAPNQVLRVSGSVYDGMTYFNSGLMSNFPALPAYRTYPLTFGALGDFIYYCQVHPGMIGVVHVRPAGTSYPFSAADYAHQTAHMTAVMLRDGAKLADWAEDHSNNHHVIAGIGDGMVGVMRFFPGHITIEKGETVTFTNHDVMDPHTITFGAQQLNDFVPYGDPTHFDGTMPLNSGFIGMNPGWFGDSFKVTFTKAGTYHFRCDLHDYLGMTMTIVVKN